MKFIDFDSLYTEFKEMFFDELTDDEKNTYEDFVDEYAYYTAEKVVEDFDKYVHFKDTKMIGNFANIRQDWNITKNFVKSEVQPWGDFDEVVKSIDNETISVEDLKKFQTWAKDWFYTAFGTWGLVYNFNNCFADYTYEEREEE